MAKITANFSFPGVSFGGLPESLLYEIFKAVAIEHGRRIRLGSQTFQGEGLDPNSETWRNTKAKGAIQTKLAKPAKDGRTRRAGSERAARAISQLPGVYTGAMTDGVNAWEFEATIDGFDMELSGDALEHALNFIEIGEETGRNWSKAIGIGELELEAVSSALVKWLDAEDIFEITY